MQDQIRLPSPLKKSATKFLNLSWLCRSPPRSLLYMWQGSCAIMCVVEDRIIIGEKAGGNVYSKAGTLRNWRSGSNPLILHRLWDHWMQAFHYLIFYRHRNISTITWNISQKLLFCKIGKCPSPLTHYHAVEYTNILKPAPQNSVQLPAQNIPWQSVIFLGKDVLARVFPQ
jgi:hypothetical protein